MRTALIALSAALLVTQPVQAEARNIIVSNDDGLNSNVLALYRELKAQGHDVIVSVPCTNQSGMGAALYIGRPITPLKDACLNNAASAGDPGAGPMTREDLPQGDFYYVAGTPVMALLYGLDVVGAARWGGEPDLVLSGPNEGQNVGAIILSSGTVSNAQYAAIRGLPAIALSAGPDTAGDNDLANPLSEVVAGLSAELVKKLDERAGTGALLPAGIALNVNFPNELADTKWRISKVGSYNAYKLTFVGNMAEAASPTMIAMARQHDAQLPPLPGLNLDMNSAAPQPGQIDDESIVFRTAIAVSPMQAGYELNTPVKDWLEWSLPDQSKADEE